MQRPVDSRADQSNPVAATGICELDARCLSNDCSALGRRKLRYAFNALEQRKASAEKELSAKQTVCTAQIFAGCATIAFAVAGGAAAKFFKRNGEAVLGTAM